MSLQAETSPARFNMGRVLGEATATYGRRFWAIALIVLVFMTAPSLILRLVEVPATMMAQPMANLPSYLAGLVITYAGNWIAISAIADFGLDTATRRPTLLDALGDSLRALPALIPFRLFSDGLPLALLVWIQLGGRGSFATYGAFTVLANIGIWWFWLVISPFVGVVTPVVLAERRGPLAAIARSFDALSGARLPFLVLYFVTHLLFSTAAVVMQIVLISSLGRIGHATNGYLIESTAVSFFLLLLGGAWHVIAATSYQELRRMRGGSSPEHLAEVFA